LNTGIVQEERKVMLKGCVFLALLVACSVVQSAESAQERRPRAAPATLQAFAVPGRPGESCFVLTDSRGVPLVRRCTPQFLSL